MQGLDPATVVPPVAVATDGQEAEGRHGSGGARGCLHGVMAPRKRLKDNATGTNSAFNLSIVLVEFSSDALR